MVSQDAENPAARGELSQEAFKCRQRIPVIELVVYEVAGDENQLWRIILQLPNKPVIAARPMPGQVQIRQVDNPLACQLGWQPVHLQVIARPVKCRGVAELAPDPRTALRAGKRLRNRNIGRRRR